MLNRLDLLNLLEELLGKYKEYKKQNEVAFYCPACGHHKPKLQVNIITGHWHCWVCQVENRMAGKSFFSLFRKTNASQEHYARLSEIVGESRPVFESVEVEEQKYLPEEYKSLVTPNESPYYRQAIMYLKNRGIALDDILKYNIGYAERGQYEGKIIIPSYGGDGKLNFFVGRSYRDVNHMTHMMPSWSKDVVGFEAFINWSMPIVLVEGAFDAIAIKVNAIPLFGKTVGESLHRKIIDNDVRDIYICLDKDALSNSVKYMKLFMGEGRNVYFVELEDKDPSKIGFRRMQEIIRSTAPASYADIFKLRLT